MPPYLNDLLTGVWYICWPFQRVLVVFLMAPKTLVVNGNIGQKLLFLSDFYKRFIRHFISIMRVDRWPSNFSRMCPEFWQKSSWLQPMTLKIIRDTKSTLLCQTGSLQRYTYRVLQTIQMKLILICVWAERAVLGSAKTA